MDINRIRIHPLGDNYIEEIRTIVEEHGGILKESSLCGMKMYEASFFTFTDAQKAFEPLQNSEVVSHAEWVENT